MRVQCVADRLGQRVASFSNEMHLSVHGDNVDSTTTERDKWLPLFGLFQAVEALHLSGGVEAYIASALGDIGEELVTDVFPALHLIWADDEK
jgi:hypothetical protein